MPLVYMKDMVDHAHGHNYAVGAFEVVNLEVLQGIIAAAERSRAPVILSLGGTRADVLDFGLLATAAEHAAQRASVPASIHLHDGRDPQSCVRAINGGCNGVMVDASHCEFLENVRITREVVAMARGCGVPVEGKLGYAPDGGRGAPEIHAAYTSVAEARGYVDKTGVDFLAVSIGTVLGRPHPKPKVDWQRLKQINEALGIPLTVYDGAGLTDDQHRRLIANGVAKIGYHAALADAAFAQVRATTKGNSKGHYATAMRAVQGAVERETERCLQLLGAAGRAAEVLQQCRPWIPVGHVVTCHGEGLDDDSVESIVAEGRRVLGMIPGVLEVGSGSALRDDGLCRYNWPVRFCHPAVVETYREHPAYVEFAARRFRSSRRAGASPRVVSWGTGRFPANGSGLASASRALRSVT